LSKESENKEVEQAKSVAHVIAFMSAVFGFFLLFLTLVFLGEMVLVLVFGAMTAFCFALAYGLWRLKKWALYVTMILMCLFTPFAIYFGITTNNPATPAVGVLIFAGVLGILYRFREHFK